jgi:membrane-bound ClpP family serine protease
MGKTDSFFQTTMIGANGRAESELNPEGTVIIRGELWQAIAAGAPINPGERITVVEQEGLTLTVARRNNADAKGTQQ